MRALVILTFLGGCLRYEETQCDEYYFFEGPGLSHSYVVPINDQFHVGWRSLQSSKPVVYTFHSAIVDGAGQVVPGSEVDHGTEGLTLLSAPLGRALYVRGAYESTYELRLATGELVGAPLQRIEIGDFMVFDGDAFLFMKEGSARRVGLDGTVGAPFTVPRPIEPSPPSRVAVTENVTWLVYTRNDIVEVVRIQRGGGALDWAPRLVTDQALDKDVAASARELVILTGSRQQAMTWHVLREDGTHTMKPLELPGHPGVRPWFGMTAEPSAYLAIFQAGALAARVTIDGIASPPFAWPEVFHNGADYARGTNGSMVVFEGREPEGEPPTIRAMAIPFGGEPGASNVVKTVEGETRFHDCGCNASGAASGPVAIGLLGLACRRRRRRGRVAA